MKILRDWQIKISGVGLKGTVVEVKKRLFRNVFYPKGEAVYASPENLAYYESYRKVLQQCYLDTSAVNVFSNCRRAKCCCKQIKV